MIDNEIKNTSMNIFNTIAVNSLFNSYAIECVTMGTLQPNDAIPVERFVKELALEQTHLVNFKNDLSGYAITENGKVANCPFDYFAKEFLYSALNALFIDAPLNTQTEDDDGIMDYKYGLREYIKGMYSMFCEILSAKVEYDFYELVGSIDKHQQKAVQKFLFDIKVKKLKQGKNVSRYCKAMGFVPHYVQRLIENKNGKYILRNNNTDSTDYKLALLSALGFLNYEHSKLLELKMQCWEQNNNK